MTEQFNDEFNKAVSSVKKLARTDYISPHTFYRFGSMIASLPIKCIQTKLALERYISNRDYHKAIVLLDNQLV